MDQAEKRWSIGQEVKLDARYRRRSELDYDPNRAGALPAQSDGGVKGERDG
jgi:hypothetical protein